MRKENKNSFHLVEHHKLTGEKQQKTMGKGFKAALFIHVWTSLSVTSPTGIYRLNGCRDFVHGIHNKELIYFWVCCTPFMQNFVEGQVTVSVNTLHSQESLGQGGAWVCTGLRMHLVMRGCPGENLDGRLRKRSNADISRTAFLQVTLSHQCCKEWHKQLCKTSNRH